MNGGRGWPLDKSLCLLPTLYPASLAYGWNMLDPADLIEPLRVRNLIVWHRPNPPVGALGDKCRPSTSYVTVACMRRDRWFDLDAERYAPKSGDAGEVLADNRRTIGYRGSQSSGAENKSRSQTYRDQPHLVSDPAGAPPLDYWQLPEDDPAEHQAWTIPTQPYAGSHYATFPIALPRRLIRLMCPQHVCRTCGEPRRRITAAAEGYAEHLGKSWADKSDARTTASTTARNSHSAQPAGGGITSAQRDTLGWSDCGHADYRRGIVLDPFAGSGTTLAAATEQGRDAIGIDLDADNYWLARERIGMFLDEPA